MRLKVESIAAQVNVFKLNANRSVSAEEKMLMIKEIVQELVTKKYRM